MRIIFTTVKHFIAILLFVKSIVACSTDDLLFKESGVSGATKSGTGIPAITEIYTDSTKNGAIVLSSDPVGNPYNVDTLKKAYTLLYPNGRGRSATPEFTPTHYQLRFLPADSLEFRNLMTSGLVLTTVPLDKKISSEGTYYFDPQLAAQGAPYTWQYTIVPVTQELPNIRHEIMAEICAAPNDGSKGRSVDGVPDIWPALEIKAYEMCGEEMPSNVQSRGAGNVGIPGEVGKYIYVWDDKANQYIPAKGAFVVAFGNSWSASTTTDEKGSYESLKIGGPITRMAIQWQDAANNWVVFDGTSENDASKQAIYACSSTNPKSTYRIKGGKQQTFAVATRALNRVYYGRNCVELEQLIVPVDKSLKVICIDAYDAKFAGNYYAGNNSINLCGKESTNVARSTQNLFGTVVHELAHMIHYSCLISDKNNWNATEKIILESWTRYLQWYATEYEYNELGRILGQPGLFTLESSITLPSASGLPGLPGQPGSVSYNTYNRHTRYNCQNWPYTVDDQKNIDLTFLPYSPILIDLADNNNQYAYFRDYYAEYPGVIRPLTGYKTYPNDQVKGYNIYQIQTILKTAKDLYQLKENVKNIHPNSNTDKIKIDTLFNRYIYYWEKYK